MRAALGQLLKGAPLSVEQAQSAMGSLVRGEVPPECAGAFLAALQIKGETPEELEGFLRALRPLSVPFPVSRSTGRRELIDTCGTGGDGAETFNISTASALVLASLGVEVAKHGNRSVSSRSGSADVLEALGIALPVDAKEAARQLDATGFCFLMAPHFHPALKSIAGLRKTLGVRTVFNALGPLLNPARPSHQVIGVYDRRLLVPFAEVLRRDGLVEAMVVASRDGLDEISLSAPTEVAHLKGGAIRVYEVEPRDFGAEAFPRAALTGGDAADNARILEALLAGAEKGPRREAVAVNAGAALVVTGRAANFREGAAIVREALAGGRATALIAALRAPFSERREVAQHAR